MTLTDHYYPVEAGELLLYLPRQTYGGMPEILWTTKTSLQERVFGVTSPELLWQLILHDRLQQKNLPRQFRANLHEPRQIPRSAIKLLMNSWQGIAMRLVATYYEQAAQKLGTDQLDGIVVQLGWHSHTHCEFSLTAIRQGERVETDKLPLIYSVFRELSVNFLVEMLSELIGQVTVPRNMQRCEPVPDEILLGVLPDQMVKNGEAILITRGNQIFTGHDQRILIEIGIPGLLGWYQHSSDTRTAPYQQWFGLPESVYPLLDPTEKLGVEAALIELIDSHWQQLQASSPSLQQVRIGHGRPTGIHEEEFVMSMIDSPDPLFKEHVIVQHDQDYEIGNPEEIIQQLLY